MPAAREGVPHDPPSSGTGRPPGGGCGYGHVGPIDASRTPRFAGPATFALLPRLGRGDQRRRRRARRPVRHRCELPARRPVRSRRTCGRARGCCALQPGRRAGARSPSQQVADAGDLAVNPFDIEEAIAAIERGADALGGAGTRLLTIGGDHTIALPLLRSVARRARPRRAGALRRPPRHLGHLLRRRLHARHAVPAGGRGRAARPGGAACTSGSVVRSTAPSTSTPTRDWASPR